MKVLSFDLEMQAEPGNNKPLGKIIQVGWCVGETNNGNVYVKKSMFVNPHEELTDFIKMLTGISQESVNGGYPLDHAYRVMMEDHKASGCFLNPVTWGCGDSRYLRKELNSEFHQEHGLYDFDDDKDWRLGRREIDVKTLYQAYMVANNKKVGGGLAKAMREMGIPFQGREHDAKDDAYNTFRLYCKLLEYFKENKSW